MVTGVETVGLVLGSLPLIIAALEHYEDISRPTREFFTWRKHRRRLIQELYTLRASFDQATHLLLQPFVDGDDMAAMKDPLSDLWSSGSIADSLRGAMGVAYDPLLLTIGEISEILCGIASHLNIQAHQGTDQLRDIVVSNPSVANTSSLRNNFEFKQRIAFTMKKKSMKMSLERLETCTNRIDTWIQRADRIQDEHPVPRWKLSFTGSLSVIQQNATRVYQALVRHRCKGRTQHPTQLLLEQRLRRPRRRIVQQHPVFSVVTESTCFKLSFDGECYQHIHRFDTEFRIVESIPNNVHMKVSIVQGPPQAPYDDPSTLPHISNLCQFIQQPAHPFFGFCIDDKQSLRVYPSKAVYRPQANVIPSVFQLSRTPWLAQKWGKKDIAFLKTSNGPHLAVDIRYPYLTQNFSSNQACPPSNDCSNLLSLAIVLMELSFGRSIEQNRHPDDFGNKTVADDITDLQTASRWYKSEKPLLSRGFQQAILTCLQEYLNPDANLNKHEYSDGLKEKILQPLEDEMQYIVFGPPR
ncbi:hypothetical protein BJX99DRAFT_265738 [Aspergillus californicus]